MVRCVDHGHQQLAEHRGSSISPSSPGWRPAACLRDRHHQLLRGSFPGLGYFPLSFQAQVTQQDRDLHPRGCSMHLPLCLGLAGSLLQPLAPDHKGCLMVWE